jgi:ribA/ribD-fused uncharacterized protein
METQIIDSFKKEYSFLSNFYLCDIELGGIIYPSIENAFQAGKAVDPTLFKKFAKDTASEAKRRGNEIKCRADWDKIKVSLMKDLLRIKFEDTTLRTKLLLTGNIKLIEGNWWHDNFWGICTCGKCNNWHDKNSNTLGKLLMEVRKECQEKT